jgi:uncharacterized BrkB/YihY/UPF0761 family membrane protein
MAASIVGGFVVKLVLLRELPADACLLFCIFVNVAGQMGDLFESAAKRAAGVKDSAAGSSPVTAACWTASTAFFSGRRSLSSSG